MDENLIGNRQEFSIGDIKISPNRNLLIAEKVELSLEPRVMDVLCYLSLHAPEVVSRDEMIENIWEVKFGGDESLTRAISILRKTFRSIGIDETMIETIPKRGYRLTKPPQDVTFSDEAVSATSSKSEQILTPPRSGFSIRKLAIPGAIGVVALIGIVSISKFLDGETQTTHAETTIETKSNLEQVAEIAIDACGGKDQVLSVDENLGFECKPQTRADSEPAISQEEKDRIVARARSQDPSTFMDALDQLEARAESYDDWRLIAEIAFRHDPNRTIKATTKALSIKPYDFFLQNLRAQTLGTTGRLIEARKSIETLNAIAKSDNERFLARYTYLNTSILIDDVELVEKAQSDFANILDSIENSLSEDLKVKQVSELDINIHPYWALAAGYQALASSNIYLGKTEIGLSSLKQSDIFFRALIPIIDDKIAFAPLRRLVMNNEEKALILKNEQRHDDAILVYQENLKLFRDLDNVGYTSIGILLPNTWHELGELFLLKEDQKKAMNAFENSKREYQAVLNDNPNSSKAAIGLSKSQEQLKLLENTED